MVEKERLKENQNEVGGLKVRGENVCSKWNSSLGATDAIP